MRFKHALACYRPVEYNAQVQPMITTPGHGTFPMGHATQTYAVAHLLKYLLILDPAANTGMKTGFGMVIEQLDRQSARIATNRVVAGVHFPVDSMAGRMLGVALGEYFVARCTGLAVAQKFNNRTFIATGAGGIDNAPTTDFNPFNVYQKLDQAPGGTFYSYVPGSNVTQSDLMAYVWGKAQEEWKGRFGVPV
jgi:hypothetical protein